MSLNLPTGKPQEPLWEWDDPPSRKAIIYNCPTWTVVLAVERSRQSLAALRRTVESLEASSVRQATSSWMNGLCDFQGLYVYYIYTVYNVIYIYIYKQTVYVKDETYIFQIYTPTSSYVPNFFGVLCYNYIALKGAEKHDGLYRGAGGQTMCTYIPNRTLSFTAVFFLDFPRSIFRRSLL